MVYRDWSGAFVLSVLLVAGDASAQSTPNHVRNVLVHDAAGLPGATEIEVVGTASPSYSVRLAEQGKRLLVDLNNCDLVSQPEAISGTRGVVGGVLTQSFRGPAGNMTRLTVNLAQAATYRVRADGNTLKITLMPEGPSASMARGAAATPVESTSAPLVSAPSTAPSKAKGGG